jgi:hypothetical protein
MDDLSVEAGRGRMELMMPLMVARAFSFELYLKCLISIEGKEVPHHHHLRKIFDILSSRRLGTKIRSLTFDSALDLSSNAFEKLRYADEKNMGDGEGWMASEISNGARRVILGLYPDWDQPFKHTIESR